MATMNSEAEERGYFQNGQESAPLRMTAARRSNPLNQGINVPEQQSFDTPEMRGSIQQILADNIGEYVVVEFILGTQGETRKQGILVHVGKSFITLYDEARNIYIVCDIFSVKFVYFYYPGDRPMRDYNTLPPSATSTFDGTSMRNQNNLNGMHLNGSGTSMNNMHTNQNIRR